MTHKGEDDEAGKKDHHHVYVLPAKRIQTDDIRAELTEYDPESPDKPRKTLVWKPSKFADWYLYALHDRRYLALKGQSRKYHYEHEQFVTSSDEDLTCFAREIDLLSLSPYADMQDAIRQGLTWEQYFRRGTVPIPQVRAFATAWELLCTDRTYRNGRANHEEDPGEPEDVDENGEIKPGSALDRLADEAIAKAHKDSSEGEKKPKPSKVKSRE